MGGDLTCPVRSSVAEQRQLTLAAQHTGLVARPARGVECGLEHHAVPVVRGVHGTDAVEQPHRRPLLGGVDRQQRVPVAQPRRDVVLRGGVQGAQGLAEGRRALDDVGGCRDGRRAAAPAGGCRRGREPGGRQRRLGGDEGDVVRGGEGLRDHARAVARVEGGGDLVSRTEQVRHDVRHGPAVDLAGREPDDGCSVEDVGRRGGEPHPIPRRREPVEPSRGEEAAGSRRGRCCPTAAAPAGTWRRGGPRWGRPG